MSQAPSSAIEYIKQRSVRGLRPTIPIIANCQTFGLAQAMRQLTSQYEFISMPFHEIQGKDPKVLGETLARHAHIFCIRPVEYLKEMALFALVMGFPHAQRCL